MVNHCIQVGLHGIFVAGSNGESLGLIQSERDRAIAIALDECGDRVPVMAGVMDTSTRRVIDNIKRLEQMGGRAAVVTPEFYARHASPSETIRHFEHIARSTNVDLFIYNIPVYTNCTLRAEAIFEIAGFDRVVGYKDSGGNIGETVKCLNHFRGTDFVILQGITQLAAISMLLGADGFVPAIAPVFPREALNVYEYGRKRDIDQTMRWDRILNECQSVCTLGKNPTSATKYVTSSLGLTRWEMTLPHEPLTDQEKQLIDKRLAELQAYVKSQEECV